MIATQANERMGGFGRSAASRKGFTAIELLVVMAVVATGTLLLCSSLARLREGERARVCLNNLGLLGRAVGDYAQDHDGTLPGPIHLAVPWNAGALFVSSSAPQPLGDVWYRQQLPTLLAPYLVEAVGGARPADLIAHCPTAAGLGGADAAGQPWYYNVKFYYVANTGAGTGSNPYTPVPHKTDPPDYFGHILLGQSVSDVYNPPPSPKKLDAIANHSTEWAIADLWYWRASWPRGSVGPVGTWPFELSSSLSGSIANQGELKVPAYPFHLTAKTFSPDLSSPDRSIDSPRLMTGKTNAVFFDGHAASVGPWRGTVNPAQ